MQAEASPPAGDLDEAVSAFVRHRACLFGSAYRVLGSAVEAEDVVQEVWLRWQRTDRSVVISPVAFLSSTTTRLAINVAQSARVRRETYIGPWLPEPIDTSSDPEVGAERGEALELALLLVLEKLSPVERAAYVLREAFDYAYPEIAEILQLSLVNVRKIVSRARMHLSDEQRENVGQGGAPAAPERLRRGGPNGRCGLTGSPAHPRCRQPVRRQRHPGRRSCTRAGPCARGESGDRPSAVPAGRGHQRGRRQRPYGRDDLPRRRAGHSHDDRRYGGRHPQGDVAVQPEQDHRLS